jgi:hypothetical protein
MEAALSCKGCSSASRIPLELVGNSQSSTNVRSYLYLEDLHYHQHFKSG